MIKWIEMGPHNPRPDDALTAIEQEGFGIVCAVLDYEGESVYRILNAVNAHDELLEACIAAMNGIGGDEASQAEAMQKLRAAIAKAEGRDGWPNGSKVGSTTCAPTTP